MTRITSTTDAIARKLYNVSTNSPSQAGRLASSKRCFGINSRYAIAAVHTRFDDVEWFVWDADLTDDLGMPAVVAQAATHDEAIAQRQEA